MLRPFPPKNASRTELLPYQIDSDAILRAVSSTYIPLPSDEPSEPYDDSKLSNLTNLASELLAQAADNVEPVSAQDSALTSTESETEKASAGLQNDAKSSNKSDGFILAMIFKIIPIGINIAKKGKTIATGLKGTAMSIVKLITNIALLTAVIVIDSIEFVVQLFVFLFKLLLCSVSILMSFPKCLTFYIIDIIMFFIFVCIVSVLFIIDMFLMVKMFTGTSCIEAFIMLLVIIEKIDKMIYSAFSIHIVHYPDKIINMCYSCSAMGSTSGFRKVASRMFKNIFVGIPTNIGGPIGGAITGIGQIFSFFNLG